jgi:hypothetical protein
LVLFQEELLTKPGAVSSRLLSFLGLDDRASLNLERKMNESGNPRSQLVQALALYVYTHGWIKAPARKLLPLPMRERVRSANLDKVALPGSAKTRLTEAYAEEVRELGRLLRSGNSTPEDWPEWMDP